MINRRDLMKNILYGGALLPLINPINVIEEVDAFMNKEIKNKQKGERAIFCIIDDIDLENALEQCARDLDCEIMFDWPNSPELLFDHHFVAVVDGSIIDESVWDMYVELSNDGDIKVPCLMVGNSEQFEMPKTNNVIRFDLNIQESIQHIISAIKTIKNNIVNISLI